MRKLFVTILCAAVAVSLSGCVNNTDDSSSSGSSSSDSSSSQSSSSSVVISDDSGQTSDIEQSDAEKMVEKALKADSWQSMDFVTEQSFVNALFNDKIVLADCEDYCLSSNIISAQLNKILVVKPKPEKAAAIEEAMDEYYEYVRNEGAFYPDQQASSAGAVKGKTDSGYIYIIVHPNGTLIADAMLSD